VANTIHNENKSVAEVLHSMKHELSAFVQTRIQIATAEMKEKMTAWKSAVPLLAGAALLAFTAFLTLTFGLIALIAEFLAGDFAWAIAAAVVTFVYLVVGGIVGWLGYREVKVEGVVPERTLRVLKADQNWIKNETRAA
jgi:uncharacterized membrane protein YqjE